MSPHAAVGDCERIRPGLIGQPANTVSSAAFVLAAVPLLRAARRPGGRAWASVAAAAALEGIGSIGYHGPGGRFSKAVHDAGLVALMATTATALVRDPEARVRPQAVGLGAIALTLHTLSRTGGPLCSCNSRLQGHALFHLVAAAALASTPPPPSSSR
jgi:hypothetical protein